MAQLEYTITISQRELARLFWPAAVDMLRVRGLFWSPRAWALIVWWYLGFRFGGGP